MVRTSAHGEPIALIDQAWAKDADGNPVATHYEVNGDSITQVVDATPTARFPVIADPRIRYTWYGFSVDFTRHETNVLAAGFTACTVMAVAVPDPTVSKVMPSRAVRCPSKRPMRLPKASAFPSSTSHLGPSRGLPAATRDQPNDVN